MPINGFLPFATGNGANVLTDQAYAASPEINQGVQAGPADPQSANKTWRQGSVMASALGQFIADFAQVDTNDGQAISVLEANFRAATAAALDGARMGVDTSSTPNAITFQLAPLPPTLSGSKVIWFKVANTNTGPATAQILKPDGTAAFPAVPIKRRDGQDPQAGDLVAGVWYGSVWDGATAKLVGVTKSEILTFGVGSGSLLNIQIITASGTYTPAAGAKKARVTATAGGGAGGGALASGTPNSGGLGDGGAAGATAIAMIDLTNVSSIPVTVGAGGAPSALGAASATRGGTGGATMVGTYISLNGGQGGFNAAYTGTPAAGGTGSLNGCVGRIIPGNPGFKVGTDWGANGGASFWGGAGLGVDATVPGGSGGPVNGQAATGSGSGGGGGDSSNSTNVQGGAGAAGIIFIEEFA